MEHIMQAQAAVLHPLAPIHGDAASIEPCPAQAADAALLYLAHDGAAGADQALAADALLLAGAWDDLSWDEIEAGLTRIRRESQPTPLFEV
jgi:hypothetical protein